MCATLKQKIAFKKIVEKRGNISTAMIEAGYDENTAKNPKNLTESAGFKELMDEAGLSDEELLSKHSELLNSAVINSISFSTFQNPKKGKNKKYKALTDEEIKKIIENAPGCKLIRIVRSPSEAVAYYYSPDSRSRKAALDMGYKLKGNYAPEKKEHSGKIEIQPNNNMTPEEQKEIMNLKNKFESELKEKIKNQ